MKITGDGAFVHRIALTLIDGVGSVLAKTLVSYCGSVEAIFREKKRALEKIPDIGPVTAAAITKFKGFDKAEKELKFIFTNNIRMFFYLDDDYPVRLKNCYDSPVLLYYKGTTDLNKSRMVAIVGTRKATDYGKKCTEQIVEQLGEMKATIISGLAYGIDICAHKTCIRNQLETVGVLAHGLDRIYPATHRPVAAKMAGHGGLLTEHISGADPDKENFPKRNRIIAGIADAVVVVEAAKKGGALITAEIANNYNRDVFAVPGRTDDPYSEGCNHLIRNHKAALIQSAEDIRYIMMWEDENSRQAERGKQQKLFVDLTGDEQVLADLMVTHQKLDVDSISFALGQPLSKVAALLLSLEFKGVLKALPGKMYQLT